VRHDNAVPRIQEIVGSRPAMTGWRTAITVERPDRPSPSSAAIKCGGFGGSHAARASVTCAARTVYPRSPGPDNTVFARCCSVPESAHTARVPAPPAARSTARWRDAIWPTRLPTGCWVYATGCICDRGGRGLGGSLKRDRPCPRRSFPNLHHCGIEVGRPRVVRERSPVIAGMQTPA
jgi:hypothetical protein